MISISEARKTIDTGNSFDIQFWTKDGELITANNVVCTSSYYLNNTFNLKFQNGEIRTIKASLMYSINNEEVYL